MSRQTIALLIEDVSAFSRALAQQLRAADEPPSHLGLMNMLARARGFRNFQHLRRTQSAEARLEVAAAPPEPVDHRRVERALNHFDASGRMVRLPSRRGLQALCFWALWARLPADEALNERAINEALNRWHLFGDPALLRRDLVGAGLLRRNADGSDYRRIERKPPAEARALIRHLAARG